MSDSCCGPGVAPIDGWEAESLAALFKALGDPVRVKIVSALAREPERQICACDFVAIAGKSQPTVSHHLKVLRESGLVAAERRGTWIWYSVVPARLAALRSVFDLDALTPG